MADHGEVKLRQGKIDNLISLYKQAYKDIVETIESSTTAGKIQKARVMATIRAQLNELNVNVDKWVKQEIPQYYYDGANAALQDLRDLGVDLKGTKAFVPISKDAIQSLVDDTSLAFAQGLTGISRNAQMIINDALKMQLNFTIAEGKLTGQALKTVSASVSQKLQDSGLTAIVDRAGRNWDFGRYAEMLVRTKAVEARNTGIANRMLQNGYDLVQVSDHSSDHPACADWEGQILSVTGNTPGYPTVDEAESDGLFHPNCQHAINPINPDIAELTNAYDNPFNYDEAEAADIEFRGPGASGVKPQQITVYHGGGGLNTSGTDLFGNAFYVARDKSVAQEFGSKVQEATLNIKPSHILTIANDAEYNKLIQEVLKQYPSVDIQQAIPRFARSKGYDAIEAKPTMDPLGGIALLNRNLLR